jgi:hypothetical protein
VKLSHTLPATSAVFDDPNLVSAAGLVPVLALADRAGLRRLADEHLSVPGDKGANAGLKVASLVAGMVAGADSIDDMALLRHGGMGRVFARAYAPSTLGSFLTGSAPVVVAQRLRKGSCGSPRGAKRLVADALSTVRNLPGGSTMQPLLRADSAFYGSPTVGAAVRGGAQVSVTVRLDPKVKAAIATIGQDAWTPDRVHRRHLRRGQRHLGVAG